MKPNIGQGDKGETSLFGGKRVSKADCRIADYGDVDGLFELLGSSREKLQKS